MHEPETAEERSALLVLWNAPMQKSDGEDQPRSGTGSTGSSGSSVHSFDDIMTN